MDGPVSPASLLVILGPTGSGKSHLALTLAEEFEGEIVNCDSVQVYRHLDVGSAKTPVTERRGIPHHLIDIVNVDEHFAAGDYKRLARQAITSIRAQGRLPIIVGGTGFYIRALLEGLSPAPQRDAALRRRLEAIAARRPGMLHRLLAAKNSLVAERIHPNDRQKLIRALEMIVLSGDAASSLQNGLRDALTGFRVVKIGLNPERLLLYEKLNNRCISMFNHGLINEVRSLLAAGYSAGSKAMQALGYKQAVSVVNGEANWTSALEDCQLKTRQYAKRQLTWFRNEPNIRWLAGFGEDGAIQNEAIVFLRGIQLFSNQRPNDVKPKGIST